MTFRQLHIRRPIWFALSIFMLQIVVSLVVGIVFTVLGATPIDMSIWGNLILTAIILVLVTRLHWWREIGFKWPERPGLVLLALFPMLVLFDNSYADVRFDDTGEMGRMALAMGLVGFVEETLYRGIMLRALMPTGVWRAAIISSAIFGLAHGMGILMGQDVERVAFQVGYAAAIGFAYAAVVIRTGALWPLILVHFAINFIASQTGEAVVATAPMSDYDKMIKMVYMAVFVVFGSLVIGTRRPRGAA